MKAVICTKYGNPEVLRVKEMAKPIPKVDEVCINIHASALTASELSTPGQDTRFVDSGYTKPLLDRCYPLDEIVGAQKNQLPLLTYIIVKRTD